MTTTAKIRISSDSDSYLARLSVVFADPIRLKIVSELFRREMSPSQFYKEFGGGTLSRVDNHFKRLEKFGWLRLVRKASGGKRRGGTEHFYRAPRLAIFDNESWPQLPQTVREEFSYRIFDQFTERVTEALEAGTLDARPERHLTWTPLVLDERGRKRVLGLVDSLFAALFEEQSDARIRLAHSKEKPMSVTVGLAAFDSPRLERNRSGILLPPPVEEKELDEAEFRLRLARIFGDEISLKIVRELSLREMSPSQYAEEFAEGGIPETSRRFRKLVEQGWLVKVREETGGKRRGGVESFYRAVKPAIFDTQTWAKVPKKVRGTFSWRIFEQLAEQVREAMDAGTFDSRADRHHSWTPFLLDEMGWHQVIAAVDKVFLRLRKEQEVAKQRLRQSTEEPVIVTVHLAAFESPC